MKKWKVILIVVLALIIAPVLGGAIYLNFILDEVTVSNDEFDEDFDLMTNENLNDSHVKNIALFGVDCRNEGYSGCRSDVIMVVSYDDIENKVIVTSVARDSYVEIRDGEFDKINHAYAFGGPQLAIQTLNRNFDLNIEDYVTVDYWAVEKIINAIGGIDIDISSEELWHLNSIIDDLNNIDNDGKNVSKVPAYGVQHLNGRQAVAYMRIRKTGDGDFERMQRQRKVMQVTLEEINEISLSNMLSLVNDLLSCITTNLTKGEIIDLVKGVVTRGIPAMEQFQVPTKEYGVGSMINSIYYFVPNTLLENAKELHTIINPNLEYKPSNTLKDISERIDSLLY